MSKRAIRQPGFSIDYVKAMREEIDNLTAENERLEQQVAGLVNSFNSGEIGEWAAGGINEDLRAENERLRLENERLTEFMETAINFYPQLEMALPEGLE
jgi:cell division protein FtsB